MGSHAEPQWEGIDKVVRGVFPKDYQLARAIIGGYGVIIAFFVLKPSGAKAVEEAPAAPVAKPATTGIPSVEDTAFGDFIENEANLNRWIDSAE
mmetsp:Transcript_22023/g.26164  ORF Transcript_22023/g.26164 Transcript_22023/m.26164 type:complete len:94 (-) Transcript_22023:405-686(-)